MCTVKDAAKDNQIGGVLWRNPRQTEPNPLSPNGTEPPPPNKLSKMSDVEQKKVVKTTNKRKGRDDKAPRNISPDFRVYECPKP